MSSLPFLLLLVTLLAGGSDARKLRYTGTYFLFYKVLYKVSRIFFKKNIIHPSENLSFTALWGDNWVCRAENLKVLPISLMTFLCPKYAKRYFSFFLFSGIPHLHLQRRREAHLPARVEGARRPGLQGPAQVLFKHV